MPTKRIEYVPQPFVPDRFVPQYGATLGALLRQASEQRGLAALQTGQNARLMWQSMGESFRRFQDRILQDRMLKERASMDRVEQERLAKRDEMAAAKEAREADRQARMDARLEQQDERLATQDAERQALRVGNATPIGAISEDTLQTLQGAPETAAASRYVFGPGTAEGPEYQGLPEQQRMAAVEKFVRERGGEIGPNGQIIMPPKPEREPQAPNPTEASLAMAAAAGDVNAQKALALLRQQRPASAGAPEQPLEEIIGDDGQPVLVRRSEAIGKRRPSSGQLNAQDRQRTGRVNAANDFLTRLNELREKINTKMGPAAGISGLARRGGAALGMDPDVAEYERIRAAGGRALAVAIMGAQNLSDADAKSWSDMLPGATVDRETAKRLTDQVSEMLSNMSSDLTGTSNKPRIDAVPDLSGLKPGAGRRFKDGPFAGQVWTLGPDGKPKQVQ